VKPARHSTPPSDTAGNHAAPPRSHPSTLAVNGGPAAVRSFPDDLFHWPIITKEDEEAVLEVLRAGTMSRIDVTLRFEREFAGWVGAEHALACCNGTAALTAAMWACGVGAGDEIICPSMTYWASAVPALMLGATVHFADIDPRTLCIDPADIGHRISSRTKVIVVVHYAGHPADMDRIVPLARSKGIRVIEDVSHAHGARYRSRMTGTLGDIAAMSMMAGKSFPVGEGGMITTSDRALFERCVAFGHYERTGTATRYTPAFSQIHDERLLRFAGAPLGGAKHRINQMCSALGRTQLARYDERIAEIQEAMNHFWDRLADVPGLRAHRVDPAEGSTMGGWYYPQGLYDPDELGGLSCEEFCAAVRAEGVPTCAPGGNDPLHLHPVFHEADIFRMGSPTAVAFGQRDVRRGPGTLPHSERIRRTTVAVPWFKRVYTRQIDAFADAFRKVAEHADEVARA
jgi:dTDP-4-amino-4,6-dideoxygalactose transaminase